MITILTVIKVILKVVISMLLLFIWNDAKECEMDEFKRYCGSCLYVITLIFIAKC